jgi:cell division septation protein DedD
VLKSARLAAHTHDDGFHEIQLNGKQLVFLFMLATVVSVVIFLCGVLVGRGVHAERTVAQEQALATSGSDATPQAAATAPATPGSDPTAAAPPPAVDDLTYFNRLEKEKPAAEQLKGKSAAPAPEKAEPRDATPAQTKARESSAPAAPQGWTVQIAALNERNAAEAIARRLTSKGYPAYVFEPPDGTAVFRVRVGKFGSRHEAETLKARLEKEEQFKPFVTR